MLKRLRRTFILINMLLVSLVLLIVFGVLMGSTSQRLRGQSVAAMRVAGGRSAAQGGDRTAAHGAGAGGTGGPWAR